MKKSVFKYIIIEDDKNIWKNITARMERYLQWPLYRLRTIWKRLYN